MKWIVVSGMPRSGESLFYTLICNSLDDAAYPNGRFLFFQYVYKKEVCSTVTEREPHVTTDNSQLWGGDCVPVRL